MTILLFPHAAIDTIAIPETVVDMPVGFRIVLAPAKNKRGYAGRLSSAFASGALVFSGVAELGTVGVVPEKHPPELLAASDENTWEHLDGFVGTLDSETSEFGVEPNSLIIIDWIDTFTPEGSATFERIQAWAEANKSRVIGIRRR